MANIIVEVHYKAYFSEKDFDRVLNEAKEAGFGYGEDPGPKEIVRRFLMQEGMDAANGVIRDHHVVTYEKMV